MTSVPKSGLVVTAHPAISSGEQAGPSRSTQRRATASRSFASLTVSAARARGLEVGRRAPRRLKAQRRAEAEEAAAILGAEIEFFDVGDYPRVGEAELDRLVDVYYAS